MLIHKLPQTPYTAFPLDWQVWAQENTVYSSSSRDRKRRAGQVCIGEAFSKLSKYERDRSKWKMLTRNVATYTAIPIPQRAHADKELTHQLAWWWNRA